MKKIFITIIALVMILGVQAQENPCIKDFDYMVNTIKTDYPGYDVKVTPQTTKDLKNLEALLRKKIIEHPDSSPKYMSKYTSWFKDNHLRIRPVGSVNKTPGIQAAVLERQYFKFNIDSLKRITVQPKTIEGLWYSFSGTIAIVKPANTQNYYVVAVQYKGYDENQIMFELALKSENEYEKISHSNIANSKTRKENVSFRLNNTVFEIHDKTRFVRQTQSMTFDKAFLYSYFPEFPNGSNMFPIAMSLTDSTFYMRIESFEDNTADVFAKQHWQEIISRPNLIIDIRNNGGGQDNFYEILSKLIYTKPYNGPGVEYLACEGNIKYYEDALKNGDLKFGEVGIKWTKTLVERMKKNIGGYVEPPSFEDEKAAETKDTIMRYPKRVGVIINDGVASSAEEFLLEAKESDKVTVFGNQNTAGVLDYSNAVPRKFPSNNYIMLCPMSRSKRLPEHPIDNIGIAPDVIIPYPANEQIFDRLDQWVYFVQSYLEFKGATK